MKKTPLDPRWFAKMWCFYKGDLFRFYYGCHKNYGLSEIVAMYKKIKTHIPRFPNLIVKNEDWEKCPAEVYFQLKKMDNGEEHKPIPFTERFSASKQMFQRNNKYKGKAKK